MMVGSMGMVIRDDEECMTAKPGGPFPTHLGPHPSQAPFGGAAAAMRKQHGTARGYGERGRPRGCRKPVAWVNGMGGH